MPVMTSPRKQGKVYLAGAGPGDADLITIKLQKTLGLADVIITDRLVNPAIISANAKKDALVLMAGKQGYNSESALQEKINQLIIQHALAGKTVVRLKGGDVAFFSNVLDELVALSDNHIPFEIIPGITAASGASAFSGIPLTARGLAQGVQFIAYNPANNFTESQWKALAETTDTLVIYMAAKSTGQLTGTLLAYSKEASTPIAVIEQATTHHQKVHVSNLKDCGHDFAGIEFSSPSLVIIGEVVNLHDRFNWFLAGKTGSVFREIERK
jgi:uroporphyrin-III C-methyltransferase